MRKLLWLFMLVGGLIFAVAVVGGVWALDTRGPKDVVVSYSYDREREVWVKEVVSTKVIPNPDGSLPQSSNTIIIMVKEGDPIKKIVIAETLVIKEGSTEPLLEIKGHDITGISGKLNIGTLTIKRVDAEELDIDAEVVRTSIANVAAEDDELDLDLEVVNVVRTGRGGPSVLYIGINPSDDRKDLTDDTRVTFTDREKTGLRVDRIRILGPSSGRGFIETLTVRDSSVFGRIEVDDVEIQNLVLQDIFLDDSP